MESARLLIADDDPQADPGYQAALANVGPCELVVARSTAEALARLHDESFDAALLALRLPAVDGLQLLERARAQQPPVPAIVVTAQPSVETSTASLRLGASDYLTWPGDRLELAAAVERLLQTARLGEENRFLRRQVERPYTFDDMIGTCPAMQQVFATIEQVANSGVDVLVVGETGTGKELVARSIHRRSRRADKPFVPVDCGAIPENLLESEFFGHERGAFTGADSRQIGLLEFADGGTFFLDELGELPMLLQAKLLRTLQERKIRRVGGRAETPVDVRIVAATSRNLEAMIDTGRFRLDLYYRINVVRVDLPPLRARGDDLGLLAEKFATRFSREMGKSLVGITPEAYQVLAAYRWPGNVRELQNVIRRGVALTQDSMIGLNDLPDALVAQAGTAESDERGQGYFALRDRHVAEFEKRYLRDLLTRHAGDVKLAAEEARLPRGTLYRLMKNHDLDGSQFRS